LDIFKQVIFTSRQNHWPQRPTYNIRREAETEAEKQKSRKAEEEEEEEEEEEDDDDDDDDDKDLPPRLLVYLLSRYCKKLSTNFDDIFGGV